LTPPGGCTQQVGAPAKPRAAQPSARALGRLGRGLIVWRGDYSSFCVMPWPCSPQLLKPDSNRFWAELSTYRRRAYPTARHRPQERSRISARRTSLWREAQTLLRLTIGEGVGGTPCIAPS
jgi:hypothetical protein